MFILKNPKYFTEVVGSSLFLSSLMLKELFNSVFCLPNITSYVCSTFKVYLQLATLRVFSKHNSFFLLMFPANSLRESCWYHLQSGLPWIILTMSGDH